MLAQLCSAGLVGVDAYPVCVEVDVATGLPGYHLVGLGASAVKEGAVRVRAALRQVGQPVPTRKITVNLAPADVRKEGAAYDLPVAIGILAAEEKLPLDALTENLMLGELGLDGSLRPVAGGLAVALLARQRGMRSLILPAASAHEAAALSGVTVYAAQHLAEVIAHLAGERPLNRAAPLAPGEPEIGPDLADVRGQPTARRALEIAAAGGHNLLFMGPPGCGKSMLARRLPGILPALTEEEALEASVVYSAAGRLSAGQLLTRRPFRAPHPDISVPGLIGGGVQPRPGEISLAHHGVLFLDELPEFRRPVIESLRQPLEDRAVVVVRGNRAIRFPARFALVAAMNPCPCGFDSTMQRACTCDLGAVRRYRDRLSGPLLDRFDLQLRVPPVDLFALEAGPAESSCAVRARVEAARVRQLVRGGCANAELSGRTLDEACALEAAGRRLLQLISAKRGLSARAIHRVLRVARTAADLEGRERLTDGDIALAFELRSLDEARP
jgi:magnesium chelatase family protein